MITTNKTPLELRTALCTTYRIVYVHKALTEALGHDFTKHFVTEFNKLDEANGRKYSECTFYELGMEMVNPWLNRLYNKPDEHNSWLDFLFDALGDRMFHGSSITNKYRDKIGLPSFSRTSGVIYDYDFEAYPYL